MSKKKNDNLISEVKRLTGEGKSQAAIARELHTRKENVVRIQHESGVGKPVASEFWEAVKTVRQATGTTWSEARKIVYHSPKWGKKRAKRAGKEYRRFKDFWKGYKKEHGSYEGAREELDELWDDYYFDTPA